MIRMPKMERLYFGKSTANWSISRLKDPEDMAVFGVFMRPLQHRALLTNALQVFSYQRVISCLLTYRKHPGGLQGVPEDDYGMTSDLGWLRSVPDRLSFFSFFHRSPRRRRSCTKKINRQKFGYTTWKVTSVRELKFISIAMPGKKMGKV